MPILHLPVQPDPKAIERLVDLALQEDIGTGDISALLINHDVKATANLYAREFGVLCGIDWANTAIQKTDSSIKIQWHIQDGQTFDQEQALLTITGSARSLLSVERTILNFIQTLSATASKVYRLQKMISHTEVKLLDTRKTLPGMRQAQKYAVRCGGGINHREGLFDAFMIKENHITASGSITDAIYKARQLNKEAWLEVEVETNTQLKEAIAAKPDIILLDNFTAVELKESVAIAKDLFKSNGGQHIPLEASGNITEDNLIEISETGINFISLGDLTKNIQAIDLSMRLNLTT